MVSWKVEDRPREFFAFIMFLASSVFGVFASLDLFLLFFFFELAVFPKYLMIVMWGSPKTKEYGGMKLTLYLFLGSVVALVGVLAIYFTSGLQTFDLLALEKAGFGLAVQKLWFPFIFIGFGVLGPRWSRSRTDSGFNAAGGSGDESGCICCLTRRSDAAA